MLGFTVHEGTEVIIEAVIEDVEDVDDAGIRSG